ncbi:ABC transporter permease [Brevibacillus centrosporus]|uniref:ABC transporter permease n=1 Tax=Brevibacillus centrosporus TaxID=54910 RepID=UPI001142F05E|nr:ABC transporter permease [Brevibacillus centrosporus]MEC2127834.1 ABC transporter permease [Brevibacillus centrosporus]GED32074.1 dipeptide transport system permease protein DppB [Brevibacillus centrosporus]
MLVFIVRRLSGIILTLLTITTLTFFLMHAIPGDPFTSEQRIPETVLKNLYAYYGLDKPLFIQYLQYMKGIFTLDFGPSLKSETREVIDIIWDGFPVSARLGIQAILIAVIFGITLGIIAALKQNGLIDYLSMVLAVIGISVPSFILATLLIHYFAVTWRIFPVASWGSWEHTILPSIALAMTPLAYIARLMRSSVLEVLEQDYLKTAIAKGVFGKRLILKHVLRNAILPVITVLGPISAGILTGSFVIEQIFGIPGLGKYFVSSIVDRDYPVILGTAVFFSSILVLLVFIVDIAYGFIDPRIRVTGRKS